MPLERIRSTRRPDNPRALPPRRLRFRVFNTVTRNEFQVLLSSRLLEAINRGEFAINGFRNRDLRNLWFSPATAPAEQRRQSAAITRKLRLLRAHGLVHKVPKTHRYQLSPHGREIINALLAARQASTAELTKAA